VDTHVPCGHFSGGRGSWWRFHLPGYAAKEETMNIREAATKFKTDEDCLTYLEQMRWPHGRRARKDKKPTIPAIRETSLFRQKCMRLSP